MTQARIYAELKADHDRQRELLKQVAETDGASERRKPRELERAIAERGSDERD